MKSFSPPFFILLCQPQTHFVQISHDYSTVLPFPKTLPAGQHSIFFEVDMTQSAFLFFIDKFWDIWFFLYQRSLIGSPPTLVSLHLAVVSYLPIMLQSESPLFDVLQKEFFNVHQTIMALSGLPFPVVWPLPPNFW